METTAGAMLGVCDGADSAATVGEPLGTFDGSVIGSSVILVKLGCSVRKILGE